jgi:hypothetical protein
VLQTIAACRGAITLRKDAVVTLAGTKWKLLKEATWRIKRTVGYEGPYNSLRGSLESKVW